MGTAPTQNNIFFKDVSDSFMKNQMINDKIKSTNDNKNAAIMFLNILFIISSLIPMLASICDLSRIPKPKIPCHSARNQYHIT